MTGYDLTDAMVAAIKRAITEGRMTGAGVPSTDALSEYLDRRVGADERDDAWAAYQLRMRTAVMDDEELLDGQVGDGYFTMPRALATGAWDKVRAAIYQSIAPFSDLGSMTRVNPHVLDMPEGMGASERQAWIEERHANDVMVPMHVFVEDPTDVGNDLYVDVDQWGRTYIPGTSVMSALMGPHRAAHEAVGGLPAGEHARLTGLAKPVFELCPSWDKVTEAWNPESTRDTRVMELLRVALDEPTLALSV